MTDQALEKELHRRGLIAGEAERRRIAQPHQCSFDCDTQVPAHQRYCDKCYNRLCANKCCKNHKSEQV
jgi:hypothetical protein